ncbi:ABC transporter substrate-binding protein [Aureispira anguillae]|uniref:ABC transporter substrate-binding protein n=1 Tax=Aureispira anguillae TaxID=2864201 RepID=A0A915VK16_9BACT|nr:ABC transporter substrate-binding protein [Aureispira anguillae]BDS09463.1 ABC transporter substrate-binding protein [Aureispira anguillae]
MNMKYIAYFSSKFTLPFSCLFFFLLMNLTSCEITKKTKKNNPDDRLDPVIGKNTNPNDTIKTGIYHPVTHVDNDKPNNNTSNKVDTITWCDTIPKSATERVVVCFEKIGSSAIKADTVAVISINNNALYTNTVIDTTIHQKLAYQVAIMMPFMSKSFIPANGREIPVRSIKAIEFYEGVLIALDSLKEEGVNLFVNVFDTQRDSLTVQEILNKRELQEADLIIGPFTSKNLKIVAEFAKEKQKPIISPLNSRSNLTLDNPYFIQVSPSFEVHSKHIVEQLHKIEQNQRFIRTPMEKNLLVLALNRDSSRVASLQKSYADYKNDFNAKIPQLIRSSATIDIDDIKPFLKKDQLNIIVMPTLHNEGFIYNSLREIQKLVDKVEPQRGYQIVIVGMDRWRYFSRINFEYYESLNLHFSSEYFADLSSKTVRQFKSDYKAIYGIGAREFGFKGFDIMLYFGRMIHKYGVNFQTHLWKEKALYNHTQFKIEPTYQFLTPLDGSNPDSRQSVLKNYENKYLNFLKFKNYQLKKVNKEG